MVRDGQHLRSIARSPTPCGRGLSLWFADIGTNADRGSPGERSRPQRSTSSPANWDLLCEAPPAADRGAEVHYSAAPMRANDSGDDDGRLHESTSTAPGTTPHGPVKPRPTAQTPGCRSPGAQPHLRRSGEKTHEHDRGGNYEADDLCSAEHTEPGPAAPATTGVRPLDDLRPPPHSGRVRPKPSARVCGWSARRCVSPQWLLVLGSRLWWLITIEGVVGV